MGRKCLNVKHKGVYVEFRGKEEIQLLNDFRRVCQKRKVPIKSIVLALVEAAAYDYENHKTIGSMKKVLGLTD